MKNRIRSSGSASPRIFLGVALIAMIALVIGLTSLPFH